MWPRSHGSLFTLTWGYPQRREVFQHLRVHFGMGDDFDRWRCPPHSASFFSAQRWQCFCGAGTNYSHRNCAGVTTHGRGGGDALGERDTTRVAAKTSTMGCIGSRRSSWEMAPGVYNYAERWLQAVDSEVTLSIKTHTHTQNKNWCLFKGMVYPATGLTDSPRFFQCEPLLHRPQRQGYLRHWSQGIPLSPHLVSDLHAMMCGTRCRSRRRNPSSLVASGLPKLEPWNQDVRRP